MRQSTVPRLWFFLACFILMFFAVGAGPNANAQAKSASAGADEIKAMLLRPGGWLAEWRGPTYTGVSDYFFEERGENIVAKIHTPSINLSCERNVTITEDAVNYDACYDTGISLHFDPDDKEYPFKGKSEKVIYKLKAK